MRKSDIAEVLKEKELIQPEMAGFRDPPNRAPPSGQSAESGLTRKSISVTVSASDLKCLSSSPVSTMVGTAAPRRECSTMDGDTLSQAEPVL